MELKMLCGHEKVIYRKRKAECSDCGSFWDTRFIDDDVTYDASYPALRGHFESSVGDLKIKTLKRWLLKAKMSLDGKVVCEVGFGGGYCLKYISETAAISYGIEISDENLAHAADLGIERENLYNFNFLPPSLPYKVDVWIFQDSFEHLLDPNKFVSWASAQSSQSAEFLIVLPEAGSFSEKIMGNFWPHRISDHQFYWSRNGIINFLEKMSIFNTLTFNPTKYISTKTIFYHFCHQFKINNSNRFELLIPSFNLSFNIGELGMKCHFRKESR